MTVERHAKALSAYLPDGPLFEAKNIADSNFRQLLLGLSGELFTAQGYLTTLNDEYLPDETTLFLNEWERALGIPDACFSGAGSIIDRRRDIVVKLAALGMQTAEDFVRLGELYGITLTVTPLADEFPLPAGIGEVEARYTMVVTGPLLIGEVLPYDVPFLLLTGESILQCLINTQDPVDCAVIYRNP